MKDGQLTPSVDLQVKFLSVLVTVGQNGEILTCLQNKSLDRS